MTCAFYTAAADSGWYETKGTNQAKWLRIISNKPKHNKVNINNPI